MRLSFTGIAFLGLALAVCVRAQDADAAKQLADAQDKLSTALHSYTLLQDENTKLKADAERAAAENAGLQSQLETARKTVEALKAMAAAARQLEPLRNQLRQAQDQVADLAQQNYDLKNKLALQGPAPTGGTPQPTRAAPAPAKPKNP